MATDINLAVGDCYIAPGVRADEGFFSCGNSRYGYKTCCGAGDTCLKANACYNARFGLTYLLGCSDPDYRDSSCPDKVFDDNPWVGLSYCNGTSNQWVACAQPRKEAALDVPAPCWCPKTNDPAFAFSAPNNIGAIAALPPVSGRSVSWLDGYTPTITTTLPISQASTSGSASSSAGTTSQSTNQSTPTSQATPGPSESVTPAPGSQQDDAGLSNNAKIGIGVGIGIAGTLLVLGLLLLFLRYRKKRMAEAGTKEGDSPGSVEPKPDAPPGILPGTPSTPATAAPSELEPTAARPWSLRSELESGTPTSMNEGKFHPSPQSGYGDGPVGYPGQPTPYRHSPMPQPAPHGPLHPIVELPG
ncbi:hypothetical protein OQA88_6010 [Cercophora sp. LCS_1]